MPMALDLRNLRQKNLEFKANLAYQEREVEVRYIAIILTFGEGRGRRSH